MKRRCDSPKCRAYKFYGARGISLLALYREHFPSKSPYLLYSQMITDAGFRRFAHSQAELKAAQARAGRAGGRDMAESSTGGNGFRADGSPRGSGPLL